MKALLPMLGILLLAAFARLWHFHEAPPGLQHDEIFKAIEAEALVQVGDLRLFYPSNQGHEGGYVWLIGLAHLLFGTSIMTIKMPAFWCGMLSVAWTYRLGKDAYHVRVGLVAAAFMAISFWAISINRNGLRANLLLPVTLMFLWGLWRSLLHPGHAGRRWGWAIFTGALLGFAPYTYTSAYALVLALGAFLPLLALWSRPLLRQRWPELLLLAGLGLLLSLPMVGIRLNDPQGQNRVQSINRPWTEFRQGEPELLLQNAVQILGMPAFTGDQEWRYNVQYRPLFILPVGLLVYLGLGLLLWRAGRQRFNLLLLALLLSGASPSLLTLGAPAYLRLVTLLPVLMLALGLAIEQLGHWLRRPQAAYGLALLALAFTAASDWQAYFEEWPQHLEVREIYRDDLEQLARYTYTVEAPLIAVSTRYPDSLDPNIYRYYQSDPQEDSAWFDGRVSMLLPQDEPLLLFVSPYAPISPAHREWLSAQMGSESLGGLRGQDGEVALEIYRLGADLHPVQERLAAVSAQPAYVEGAAPFSTPDLSAWAVPLHYPVNIGNVLQVQGVEIPRQQIPAIDNGLDNGLNLQLYLRPLVADLHQPLSIFVHILREDGQYMAGRDFLGWPAATWNPAIGFVQDNYVGRYFLEPGIHYVTMGLYNSVTGERYPILDAEGQPIGDRLLIGQVEAGVGAPYDRPLPPP